MKAFSSMSNRRLALYRLFETRTRSTNRAIGCKQRAGRDGLHVGNSRKSARWREPRIFVGFYGLINLGAPQLWSRIEKQERCTKKKSVASSTTSINSFAVNMTATSALSRDTKTSVCRKKGKGDVPSGGRDGDEMWARRISDSMTRGVASKHEDSKQAIQASKQADLQFGTQAIRQGSKRGSKRASNFMRLETIVRRHGVTGSKLQLFGWGSTYGTTRMLEEWRPLAPRGWRAAWASPAESMPNKNISSPST